MREVARGIEPRKPSRACGSTRSSRCRPRWPIRITVARSTPGRISTSEAMWFCVTRSSRRAISASVRASSGGASCGLSRRSFHRNS